MRTNDELRRIMAAWVLDGSHRETLGGSMFADDPRVSATDPADIPTEGWSVSGLLCQLWGSADRLPRKVAEGLGLPEQTTFGQAAQLLWWLRTGPRFGCSSYAGAIRLLHHLDEGTFRELYQRVAGSATGATGSRPGRRRDRVQAA